MVQKPLLLAASRLTALPKLLALWASILPRGPRQLRPTRPVQLGTLPTAMTLRLVSLVSRAVRMATQLSEFRLITLTAMLPRSVTQLLVTVR